MRECNGGCHCGRVRYEVKLPDAIDVHRCNCSICQMSGFLHVIVSADDFRLLSGEESLSEYRFHTRQARHLFCKYCGVKSFYVPRSHPDGFSVNLNCLELADDIDVSIEDFNGQNWLASRADLT